MKYVNKLILSFLLLISLSNAQAQGIKEFCQNCNVIPLNSPFQKDTTHLVADPEKYSLRSGSYLLPCAGKTLYNLPVQKVLLIAYDDTARAISIFLPFDSTLHKRMEEDLGVSEGTWMAVEAEAVDTTGMIRNRRWFFDNYIIVYKCTRYITLLGEQEKDDRIIITVSKRK